MRRIAIIVLFSSALAACAPQRASRTLSTSLPAAGVTSLFTHANIGSVAITASPDASVHVSVKLEPSNNFFWDIFTHGNPKAIAAATLGHALDKGELDLSIQYPAASDAEDVQEDWHIAVPASVHVKSQLNVGKLQVNGITGGVAAQINIGKVTLDVPGGPLDVSMNIGKINAQAHSVNYGDVMLAADVGNTRLTVDGMTVGDQQKQGTGSQMNYKGKGIDPITLKTNTGKVSLALSGQAPSTTVGTER